MPRKARLIVPGAVYHVMGRCLDHYQLFPDDVSREHFLSLLEVCLARTKIRCYAWVLMNNHYHLVLRLGDSELWEIMKPLNMRYAQFHRKKTNRRGPLFLDRYKSIVTQDQNYVQELVRYVHLNPIRAGICKDLNSLEKYPWCGHAGIMGRKPRLFQDTKSVLRRFGKVEDESCAAYRHFLHEGLNEDTGSDRLVELVRKSNLGSEEGRKAACWVIGDRDFVKEVTESKKARQLRISQFEKNGGTFGPIVEKVCALFKLNEKLIQKRQRGGPASEARKLFAYISVKGYRAPLGEVADYLGVGNAAVSAMVHKGSVIAEKKKFTI